ncbi:uncharacterized protein LACBIDRAFT_304507 [Laccaria bicolor S238N-H82]|uniref:Predicted protein n=1 Tax=Laccaria bicolor (strain S238N-H82 / ATCC MYA-4686) TaxID=486041 RepID=B0DLS3_LACBS|nr:uncharacterized protein LACBIDRAFT_304507 [Laccaria bicolor S238N-H82]EDR04344.1 predicted protein [Laccaria bicolor S238N-H82]|eukprot:XP_001884863.1 predicted protein [Laccaria bicolor S238N-H82]
MAWTGVSNAGEAERGRGCGHASVGRCRKIEAGWVWCQAQADWGVVVVGHLRIATQLMYMYKAPSVYRVCLKVELSDF